jgi:DNA-binding XRE family transcriptional regulator
LISYYCFSRTSRDEKELLSKVGKIPKGDNFDSICLWPTLDLHNVVTRDIKFEKSVGAKIKEFRKALGLSQQKLADDANLEKKQIQRVEKAEHSATLAVIVAISKALGKQPYELLKSDLKVKVNAN